MAKKALKIGIIGGSLGGLFTGIALLKDGHDVSIFEKTGEQLKDRGAGIVLQYELLDFFNDYNIAALEEINVPIRQRRYVDREGADVYTEDVTQLMTAWGTIYHKLLHHFPAERYHYGHRFENLRQEDEKVTVSFQNGRTETFDLLIGADGTNSSVRRSIFPEIHHAYAGYVGWRGIVPEAELPAEVLSEFVDRFTFYNMPNSHILCYLIPGNDDEISAGSRRLNWVWYWNVPKGDAVRELLTDVNGIYRPAFVPEGYVKPEFVAKQRQIADELMPPIFKSLVGHTKNPFIQPINDLTVERMYSGRVVLIGDAAFTPRPHTAASTAKAVANGVALAGTLRRSGDDVGKALAVWERPQLEMGKHLWKMGMALGNQSQFGVRSVVV